MRLLRYCLLVILWPVIKSHAQAPPENIRPLHIGDTVPDIEFSHVSNYPVSKIRLSDFNGKIIILDFWATWCSSCIYTFPKSDSLQAKFPDQIQIILVNSITGSGDTEAKLNGFFKKWIANHTTPLRLLMANKDTIARALFPHLYIPHYVWIGKDRTVVGLTSSEELTESNIRLLLNGCIPKWKNIPVKQDD